MSANLHRHFSYAHVCALAAAVALPQVCDWSKEPYVRGAYTYPTLGAELGDRELLAAPVAGTIFFAGKDRYHGIM